MKNSLLTFIVLCQFISLINATSEDNIKELIKLTMQKEAIVKSLNDGFELTRSTQDDNIYCKMIQNFENKFDSDSTLNEFMKIYENLFSETEIIDLLNFYKSPIGKKYLKEMPELLAQTSSVSMRLIEEAMTESVDSQSAFVD